MNIRAGYLNKNTATATAIMSIFKCVLISNKYLKNKVNRTTKAQLFLSSNHHTLFPYHILGDKPAKNDQTTEILPK